MAITFHTRRYTPWCTYVAHVDPFLYLLTYLQTAVTEINKVSRAKPMIVRRAHTVLPPSEWDGRTERSMLPTVGRGIIISNYRQRAATESRRAS